MKIPIPSQRISDVQAARRPRTRFHRALFCAFGVLALSTILTRYIAAQDNVNQVVSISIPVGVEAAPVLASPSPDSYVAGTVLKGNNVEIYFRNAQGYCAIRPPRGCYSWVNGKFIETDATEKLGRVVSPSGKAIPSRVGGDSPTTSSVVQVGLQDGQKLRLLGKVALSDGSTWYKISPPSGEFRWIKEDLLVQDEALAFLPSKLTFQSENASNQTGEPVQDANQDGDALTLDFSQFDSGGTQETQSQSSANAVVDISAFKLEVARLNADVFQTLQKKSVGDEEFKILALRAESLFDAAPNDEERYAVQALFSTIKKAEKERSQFPRAQQAVQASRQSANSNGNQVSANGSGGDLTSFYRQGALRMGVAQQSQNTNGVGSNAVSTQNTRFPNTQNMQNPNVQSLNVQGLNQQNIGVSLPQIPNSQGVRWIQTVAPNGATQVVPVDANGYVLTGNQGLNLGTSNAVGTPVGTLPTSYSSVKATKETSDVSRGSKMEFAFSSDNSPFSFKTKSARVVSDASGSQSETHLSRLPSLFPTTQSIVPPQNYNVGIPLSQNRKNSKLVAQARSKPSNGLNKEISAIPETQLAANAQNVSKTAAQSKARKSQGITVFQAPQVAQTESRPAPQTNGAISSASSEVPQKPDQPKIRQTNAFKPVAVRTKNGYDAEGTLLAVSSAGEGAPRYALMDATGGNFRITAYLESSKGVILERFVGKKIGVKGNVGTIAVDGKPFKLVVVNSAFPQ